MMNTLHSKHMALAITQAKKGYYTTHPNPRVGCVIVKNNRVIAQGYHHRAGEPHAEIMALEQASEPTQGATLYVSLEPCCHHGRTPPCTQAIIKAGIKNLYIATTDPNPIVQNRSIATLRAAGIKVHTGLLEDQAQQLNPGYWQRHSKGRPWIRVKLAISMDGRTTSLNRHSRLITSLAARQDVQHWRALSSAIITGSNSVITDNPQLNVRNLDPNIPKATTQEPGRQPDLFIIDNPALTIPQDARIFNSERHVYLITGPDQEARHKKLPSKLNILTIPYKPGTHYLDLTLLSQTMGKMQINEILVEAGMGISSQYIQSGLTDQLILYQAPKLLGDQEKGVIKPNWQQQGIKLHIHSITQFDQDIRYVAKTINPTKH